MLDLSPDQLGAWYWRGIALLLKGEFEAALENVQREPYDGLRLTGLALVYHSMGDAQASDDAMQELIGLEDDRAYYSFASIHAWRGETELAFEALARAEQLENSMSGMNITPFFDSLKGDPRWQTTVERLGISQEQLDAIPFEVEFAD